MKAMVIGAGRMGEAVASLLLRRGATVGLADLSADAFDRALDRLGRSDLDTRALDASRPAMGF